MKTLPIALTIGTLLAGTQAFAQQGTIEVRNEVFKEVEVTNEDGSTEYELVEPGTVLPNDEVIYITTFRNIGDQPATDIVITNPLPNNSVYKTGSAFGAGTEITYSVDGGETYAPAEALQVVDDQGQTVPATAEDYTHIRWIYTQALEPGEESTVTFRTIVNKRRQFD